MSRRTMPPLLAVAGCLLLGLVLAGCVATGAQRLVATRAAGARTVPRTIAIHPLLSTVPTAPGSRQLQPLQTERQPGEVTLQPPTRTQLLVTGPSQMLTDLLEAELSYAGFRVKALPVQARRGADGAADTFGIGLDLLARLRREYGLQAVVVGNVQFTGGPTALDQQQVGAAFLRIIDIASLDVLAHIALEPGPGLRMADVAAALADEMARLAGAAAGPAGAPAPPATGGDDDDLF